MEKIRNSSFEVLRLVCMLSIVLYHMLIHGLNEASNQYWFYKALTIVLHFGVPVFILISGWFSIKLSTRRCLSIVLPLWLYTLLLYFINPLVFGTEKQSSSDVINIILCKDESSLWFIQPYLLLCLVSPILNTFFEVSSNKNLISIYILWGIVVFVFGFIGNYAIARDGYTLFCFSYLYLIGRGLRKFSSRINEIRKLKLVCFTSLLLIFCFIIVSKYICNKYLSSLAGGFFAYNSPLMYLYSIVIFYLFSLYKFESKLVNYISKGAFSIFLIASNPQLMSWTTNKALDMYSHFNSPYLTIICCFLFALIICVFCLIIDMVVRPVIIKPILSLSNQIKKISDNGNC